MIVDIEHFEIFLINLFKKMKHWNRDIIGYGVIRAGCQIEKELELRPSPPSCKRCLKIIALANIYQLDKFGDLNKL